MNKSTTRRPMLWKPNLGRSDYALLAVAALAAAAAQLLTAIDPDQHAFTRSVSVIASIYFIRLSLTVVAGIWRDFRLGRELQRRRTREANRRSAT